MIQFLLNNSIPLMLCLPIAQWMYQFWKSNFRTNDVSHIDLIARWSYLQRRLAGSKIAYIEYPEYETPQDDKSRARRQLDWRVCLSGGNLRLKEIARKAHSPDNLAKSLEHLKH